MTGVPGVTRLLRDRAKGNPRAVLGAQGPKPSAVQSSAARTSKGPGWPKKPESEAVGAQSLSHKATFCLQSLRSPSDAAGQTQRPEVPSAAQRPGNSLGMGRLHLWAAGGREEGGWGPADRDR